MAAPVDSKFSNFSDGGDLQLTDIVVGLRNGINSKFNFNGTPGIFLPLAGGTMSGSIDMANNTITAVPLPTNPTDVTSKLYVDNTIAANGTVNAGLVNQVAWYAASGVAVSGLPTANNSVLITDAGGAPSISNNLPTAVTIGGAYIYRVGGTDVALADGGTNASLTASNGGIFYSTATAGAILAGTAAARQMLQSGASAAPAWSTATWPATTTANAVLFSSATNVVGEVSSVANAVMITSAGSVPSFSTTLPAGLTIPGYQTTITPAALTKTDDTNVTLTLGGSPNTALLQATSLTLGWSGQLSVPRGGTGNSTFTAYSVICAGTTATGAFQNVSGVGTSGQVLQSNGAGLLPTWATIPGAVSAALTKTDDTNVTLTLGGAPTTALLTATSLTLGWTGQLGLTRGGSNASLTASNGGIVYSGASALAILAGTATAGQMLQSGASTTPAWSTTTYPATNAINTIMYASSANILGVITPVNSAVLISSGAGVPSMSTTLPAGLTIPGYAASGANADITSLTGLTGVIKAPTAIQSSASLTCFQFNYTASSVNYLVASNNSTGNSPYLQGTGSDSTVGLNLVTKNGPISLVDSTGTGAPAMRWTNAANTHFIGFKASSSVTADIDFTWPTVDGSANYPMITNGSGVLSFAILPVAGGGSGVASSNPVIQRVSTETGAVNTGSTLLPFDDTIPQNTEGDEYMTLAITPKNTNNILKIEVTWIGTNSATGVMCAALFQDSTASSLACAAQNITTAAAILTLKFTHTMTAGTTSATTFKVRAGIQNSGTTTFNGSAGARKYGGVFASSIVITEYSS